MRAAAKLAGSSSKCKEPRRLSMLLIMSANRSRRRVALSFGTEMACHVHIHHSKCFKYSVMLPVPQLAT